MSKVKGLKTILVNAAMFVSYALAWDDIGKILSPEAVAQLTVLVNMVLRVFTTGPVGKQG